MRVGEPTDPLAGLHQAQRRLVELLTLGDVAGAGGDPVHGGGDLRRGHGGTGERRQSACQLRHLAFEKVEHHGAPDRAADRGIGQRRAQRRVLLQQMHDRVEVVDQPLERSRARPPRGPRRYTPEGLRSLARPGTGGRVAGGIGPQRAAPLLQ